MWDSIETAVPRIADSRVKALYEFWLARSGMERVPTRRELDPTQIPTVLSIVWLYELEEETDRFRCRLAGESIGDRYGGSIRNRYVEDILGPEVGREVDAHYRRILAMPAIGHSVGRVYSPIGRTGLGERILLPVTDDEGRSRLILGATAYAWFAGDAKLEHPEETIRRTIPLEHIFAARGLPPAAC